MNNSLNTSIGNGYDFIQRFQGVASGSFTAQILGLYNDVYGWHKYEYFGTSAGFGYVKIDGSFVGGVTPEDNYRWIIENCNMIVFTSFYDRDLWVFDSTLKLLDGTTATPSNMVGKLCYFTNDFNISYLD